jgi:hypothetical protein
MQLEWQWQDEAQLTLAIERIEAELKDAHLYARRYGKGWDHVEELQRLYAQYKTTLERERQLVAA